MRSIRQDEGEEEEEEPLDDDEFGSSVVFVIVSFEADALLVLVGTDVTFTSIIFLQVNNSKLTS